MNKPPILPPPYQQPAYWVRIGTSGCGYSLRWNDCPLLEKREGLAIQTRIDINSFARNGENKFSAVLLPLCGETELDPELQLVMELWVEDQRIGLDSRVKLGDLKVAGTSAIARPEDGYPPGAALFSERTAGQWSIRKDFQVAVPFGPFAWMSSSEIALNKATERSLLDEIEKLHSLFAAGDLDKLVEVQREKFVECARANYKQPNAWEDSFRRMYKQITGEFGFSLQPAQRDGVEFRTYGDGRIVRVIDENEESTLYFMGREGPVAALINFAFRRDPCGAWIIAR